MKKLKLIFYIISICVVIIIPSYSVHARRKIFSDIDFYFHSEEEYNFRKQLILNAVLSINNHIFELPIWIKDKLVISNGMLIDGKECKGDIEIPDCVKIICYKAFEYNTLINNINIPDSVTYIDDCAFAWSSVRNVSMTDSVKFIGEECFCCCNLHKINLSNSLKNIESSVFQRCYNLKSITIPSNVTLIKDGAFCDCNNLKIAIPDSVTNMEYAFICDIFMPEEFNLTIYYSTDKSNAKKYAEKNNKKSEKIALTKTDLNLSVGEKAKLQLNSQSLCEWKSSDKNIATVSKNGKVTAKSKGETIITATLYDIEYNCNVVVE